MRIAVVTRSNRIVGGVETYLEELLPELNRIGHSVALFYEVSEPNTRESINLPELAPSWCVSDIGAKSALAAICEWRPDLVFTHGLLSDELEAELIRIAPCVFMVHGYYGTCVSGSKTFKYPVSTPCSERFGWKCLLHYYPHRCGGLNPSTMWHNFRVQTKRLELLKSYDAVVTLSEHMKSEYLKHGIEAERAWSHSDISTVNAEFQPFEETMAVDEVIADPPRESFRLLFVGRMEFLKGGHLFLDALSRVNSVLARRLFVTFAGDGPDRDEWELHATRVQAKCPDVQIEFTGWIDKSKLDSLLGENDVLVFPSIWPEPFGLIGPQAGRHGLPVAAFASGGTLDWLTDGVNGFLAPSDPPTSDGLSNAIIKCLDDTSVHSMLRHNAIRLAKRFELRNHLTALSSIFDRVAKREH